MEEDIEYSGSGQIEQDNYFIAIDRTSLTVQSAWYSFVLTLGLIGNLYIILTVWCRKDMSSTTNLFIVNLAISDLGILAISLPAAFINDYFPWPFDKLTCQIFVPLNEVFFCVSIFTLTIITLERVRVVCRPFKPRISPKEAKIIIVIVWIVSYLAVGFPLSFLMKIEEPRNYRKCMLQWPDVVQKRLHICFIATLIIVPLFTTAGGYAAIVVHMRRQSARIRARANSVSSDTFTFQRDMLNLQSNTKLIKMLLVIVIVFWTCMLPLTLLALASEFGGIDTTSKAVQGLYSFFKALFLSNSAFNPIAVYVMSSELRKGLYAFQKKLSRHFCTQN